MPIVLALFIVVNVRMVAGKAADTRNESQSTEQHKMEVINAGIGGNTSAQLLGRIEQDVIIHQPAIVIVMVGTNDMVNSGKLTAYDQYRRNLQSIVRQLRENDIEIVLMSPPPVDTNYLFERHDRTAFEVSPNERLHEARNIVAQVAHEENVHFIDVQQAFMDKGFPSTNDAGLIMDEHNSDRRDGVHPTAVGYRFIGKLVYEYLKAEDLLKKNGTTVCFGDSITRGVHMEGVGTAEGHTYPAVLRRLLESRDQL